MLANQITGHIHCCDLIIPHPGADILLKGKHFLPFQPTILVLVLSASDKSTVQRTTSSTEDYIILLLQQGPECQEPVNELLNTITSISIVSSSTSQCIKDASGSNIIQCIHACHFCSIKGKKMQIALPILVTVAITNSQGKMEFYLK